jgi:hypothetical protein
VMALTIVAARRPNARIGDCRRAVVAGLLGSTGAAYYVLNKRGTRGRCILKPTFETDCGANELVQTVRTKFACRSVAKAIDYMLPAKDSRHAGRTRSERPNAGAVPSARMIIVI